MLRRPFALAFLIFAAAPVLSGAPVSADEDPGWIRVQLDDAFVSEGVAVADVNRDGKLDVLAGDVWYEAPDWKRHEIRERGTYDPAKGYSQSFANFACDVNGDGWDDLIVVGFPGAPAYWYENPRNEPGHWKRHLVWHSAGNESPQFGDLLGAGRPVLIVGSEPEKQLGFLPVPAADPAEAKWDFHPLGAPGNPSANGSHRFYHGLGLGDINGDGRRDVVIPHGWYAAPADRTADAWTFHPIELLADGKKIAPPPVADIHVYDFDGDGHADLVMSSAHRYGLWWFRNLGDGKRFEQRLIDDSYSQTHALALADIDGDGRPDLVTGKRYFAHNGNDPGGRDPVVMFWYEFRKDADGTPRFIPHEIVAGRDTGIGTQFVVRDMNGDGQPDIVLSNKKGVNVLLQDERPHLVIVMAEEEYGTEKTLPKFAREHLDQDFRVSLVFANPKDRHDIPGLEALDDADLAIFSIRRRAPTEAQMAHIRKFFAAEKPLIALRTTSHAFHLKGAPPPAGHAVWEEFDREILGGFYQNHHGGAKNVAVTVADGAADHPILAGVDAARLVDTGSLYRSAPLSKTGVPLLIGTIDGADPEPIAWTDRYGAGEGRQAAANAPRGRVFYAAIGSPRNFEDPQFVRLLKNAVRWAAGD
ncbi:MAG: FG-GAP-like repeat-containing protein [Planctomycetaceae bacterium]